MPQQLGAGLVAQPHHLCIQRREVAVTALQGAVVVELLVAARMRMVSAQRVAHVAVDLPGALALARHVVLRIELGLAAGLDPGRDVVGQRDKGQAAVDCAQCAQPRSICIDRLRMCVHPGGYARQRCLMALQRAFMAADLLVAGSLALLDLRDLVGQQIGFLLQLAGRGEVEPAEVGARGVELAHRTIEVGAGSQCRPLQLAHQRQRALQFTQHCAHYVQFLLGCRMLLHRLFPRLAP